MFRLIAAGDAPGITVIDSIVVYTDGKRFFVDYDHPDDASFDTVPCETLADAYAEIARAMVHSGAHIIPPCQR